MNNKTKLVLEAMLPTKQLQDAWLSSYNYYFGMSPQKMIDEGREEEVYGYLHFYAFGPY